MVWLFRNINIPYYITVGVHTSGRKNLYTKQAGRDPLLNKISENRNTYQTLLFRGREKALNTLWNLVEPSSLSSTYENTLPVNQQILPSILIRLNLLPGRYPNKLVIPIKLFPINLHFMGVLTLFHLNSIWDFCTCDFSSTFPINKGYRFHSRKGICRQEMLVF